MSIPCPHCNSQNTQKFSLIYRSGTADINLTTVKSTYGVGGLSAGAASTSGTTQSHLASQCAPPEKRSYFLPVVGIFIGGCVLSLLVGAWVIDVMYLLLIGYIVLAIRHNFQYYPMWLQEWNEKYICLRCDTIFLVQKSGTQSFPKLLP